MQLIAKELGGTVVTSSTREYGGSSLKINENSKLFNDVPKNINIWMSHSDSVKDVPTGFRSVASTTTCKVASFEHIQKQIFIFNFIQRYHTLITGKISLKILSYKYARQVKIGPVKRLLIVL